MTEVVRPESSCVGALVGTGGGTWHSFHAGKPVTSRPKLGSTKGNTGHMIGDELTRGARKAQMLMIGDELTGIGSPGKPCHHQLS